MKAVGKDVASAMDVRDRFRQFEDTSAFGVEVELIAGDALAEISKRSSLAAFSIRAGTGADVIFLYTNDICDESEKPPRHAKAYGQVGEILKETQAKRIRALTAFQDDAISGGFPLAEHSAWIEPEKLAALIAQLDAN